MAHVGEEPENQVAVRVMVKDVSVAIRLAPMPKLLTLKTLHRLRIFGAVQRDLEEQKTRVFTLDYVLG